MARKSVIDGDRWIVKRGHTVWQDVLDLVEADGQVSFQSRQGPVTVPAEGTTITPLGARGILEGRR